MTPKIYTENTLLAAITQEPIRDFTTRTVTEVQHNGITVQTNSKTVARQVFEKLSAVQLKKWFGYVIIDGTRVNWSLTNRKRNG
jgi:hypothetical protein